MVDSIYFDIGRSVKASSGTWYKNHQILGVGGNAVTYLVVATAGPHKGVPFALKIFRRLSRRERREAFLAEVEFLEGCNHPAVMRTFDRGTLKFTFAGEEGEYPFVVAEYLPVTLYNLMRAGSASIVEKASYAIQLLSALSYLEGLDPAVVHRDIKPQNIFVKGHSCVLGDFGLMKLVDQPDDEDREILKESVGPGMPFFYRTPDLVKYARQEGSISTKSDVFQLGLVLTELFTGRNPARRPAENDMLSPVELEDIRGIPGDLSGGIYALLRKMLIVDETERPSTSELMDGWMGLFNEASERTAAINGKIFS